MPYLSYWSKLFDPCPISCLSFCCLLVAYMWQVYVDQTMSVSMLELSLDEKLTRYFKKKRLSFTLSLLPWLYHSHPLLYVIISPSLSYTPPYVISLTLSSLAQCDSAQQLTLVLVHDLHTVCVCLSQFFLIIMVGIQYFMPFLRPGIGWKTRLCRKHVERLREWSTVD